MWQINEGWLVRYRCYIEHAYLAEAMELAPDDSMRRALEGARRSDRERWRLMEELGVSSSRYRQRLDNLNHSKMYEDESAPTERPFRV